MQVHLEIQAQADDWANNMSIASQTVCLILCWSKVKVMNGYSENYRTNSRNLRPRRDPVPAVEADFTFNIFTEPTYIRVFFKYLPKSVTHVVYWGFTIWRDDFRA